MKTRNEDRHKSSYLSFRLDKEVFAVSVHKVLEVLEIQKITEVPRTPDYMRGVINFRGEILPVIDTRVKFNLPPAQETNKTVIIVLDLIIKDKQMMIGALADGVKDVIEIAAEEIKPVPEMGSHYNTEFLNGMFKADDDFIMILDIEKVFSVADVQLVQAASDVDELEEYEEKIQEE